MDVGWIVSCWSFEVYGITPSDVVVRVLFGVAELVDHRTTLTSCLPVCLTHIKCVDALATVEQVLVCVYVNKPVHRSQVTVSQHQTPCR